MQLLSFAIMKFIPRTPLWDIASSQGTMSISENLKTELWRTNRSHRYFKDGRGPLQFRPPSLSVCHASMQPPLKILQLLLPLPGWFYFTSFPHFKPHASTTSTIVIALLRGCLHKSSLELFGWETTNMHAQIASDLLPPSKLKQYWGLQVQNSSKSSHPRAFIQQELVIIQLPITHLLQSPLPFHPSRAPQLIKSITRFLVAERNYSFQGSRFTLSIWANTQPLPHLLLPTQISVQLLSSSLNLPKHTWPPFLTTHCKFTWSHILL